MKYIVTIALLVILAIFSTGNQNSLLIYSTIKKKAPIGAFFFMVGV